MGELICLDKYRRKKLEKEVEDLREELNRIIEENDLAVENVPYYVYNNLDEHHTFILIPITPPDFYY